MFKNRYPLFTEGRILKTEMLEDLRDYPRQFFDIKYDKFSDGILYGCNIDVIDNFIVVKRGIIKHDKVIYILSEDTKIEYECNNKLTLLKIKFKSESVNKDYIENCSEIFFDDDTEIKEDEMELCRFQLRSGANLRINYTGFEDFNTQYDTVNLIYAPYSSLYESSINPEILRRFVEELFECRISEGWDITFAITCMQCSETIQRQIIINYLVYKIKNKKKQYSNEDIYYFLLDVLKCERENNGEERSSSRRRSRKILID